MGRPPDAPGLGAAGGREVLDAAEVGATAEIPEREVPKLPNPRSVFRRLDERYSGLTALLVLVDAVAIVVATVAVGLSAPLALGVGAVQMISRSSARIYRRRLRLSFVDDLPSSLVASGAGLGVAVVIVLLVDPDTLLVVDFAYVALVFLGASEVLRCGVFALARWARRRYARGERTAIIGASPIGLALLDEMAGHPEFGLRPIGYVDRRAGPGRGQWLGSDIAAVVAEQRLVTVVIAFGGQRDVEMVNEAMIAHRLGCSILIVPRMFELYHDATNVERLRSYPLVRLTTDPTRRPSWWIKRGFDVLTASLALLVFSPVLIACAAAVVLENGRPILFRQERIGLDGESFQILKFRSMRPETAEESQTRWSIAGDPRVGRVGRVLRRTSLDELPQLWNILKGEMSIVGPRPERPGFVEQFSVEHERYWARHRVPTGLTGLAQVNGLRGDTSIADRARYDNYYIANWSLWLDVKIILFTFRELLRRGDH